MQKELTTVAQSNDWYLCSCGDKFPDKDKFGAHLLGKNRWAKHKGEEPHTSAGRVDAGTGEITMPPFGQRTDEQKKISRYSATHRKSNGGGGGGAGGTAPLQTTQLDVASELRLITRSYSIDYSPVMRLARVAANRYWGWPLDMPLGDFIDTVFYRYFKIHGVTLEGFFIEETPKQQAEREALLAKLQEEANNNGG